MSICIFHKWVRVEDADHRACFSCFRSPEHISEELKEKNPEYRTKGYCQHSFKVCTKCGKAVGYGSHGKLTVVPDTCKAQIVLMGGRWE